MFGVNGKDWQEMIQANSEQMSRLLWAWVEWVEHGGEVPALRYYYGHDKEGIDFTDQNYIAKKKQT